MKEPGISLHGDAPPAPHTDFVGHEWFTRARALAEERVTDNILDNVAIAKQDLPIPHPGKRGGLDIYIPPQNRRPSPEQELTPVGQKFEPDQAKNFAAGDIVLIETTMPISIYGGQGVVKMTFLKGVFAGVIDAVDPNNRHFALKRGVVAAFGRLSKDPLTQYGGRIPFSIVTSASTFPANDPASVYYERQLYARLKEAADKIPGVKLTATDPHFVERVDMDGFSRLEKELEQALDGGLDEGFAAKEQSLRDQIADLIEQLGNLPDEKLRVEKETQFQLGIVRALRKRAERVYEMSQEEKEKSVRVYELLQQYGFKPELVNPHFYPYVRDSIEDLASLRGEGAGDTARKRGLLNLTAEETVDMFAVPDYGESISPSEALFFDRVQDVLQAVGNDPEVRRSALAILKRNFSRYVHPDVATIDEDLETELFKVGFGALNAYKPR